MSAHAGPQKQENHSLLARIEDTLDECFGLRNRDALPPLACVVGFVVAHVLFSHTRDGIYGDFAVPEQEVEEYRECSHILLDAGFCEFVLPPDPFCGAGSKVNEATRSLKAGRSCQPVKLVE